MLAEIPQKAASRRDFIRVQIVKGGFGFILCVFYLILFGRLDGAEALVFVALTAPLGLALLARRAWGPTWALERLEAASLALFAVLVAVLSAPTGGIGSPFLIWLALVPFEGALAGRRSAVVFAGLAAVFAFASVAAGELLGALPSSRLPAPHDLWFGITLLIAIVQASVMAIAAQEQHRAAVLRDMHARKTHELALIAARDSALDASRAKSRFLANMSHELRTPLNAIIGFSDVMIQEIFGPVGSVRYQEYTRLINESGAHLLELINSILDMSKIEAGRFDLAREPFDLMEIVDQALRFVKLAAERHGVTLEHAIDPSARQIFADRRAILQILINLLSNGVKFTPNDGTVRVVACRRAEGLEIGVTDTGTGIAEADVQRLGQPFEQADNQFARAKEGTGLGLALVRSLAQLHGGTMRIDSILGEGTMVSILLPHAGQEEDGVQEIAA